MYVLSYLTADNSVEVKRFPFLEDALPWLKDLVLVEDERFVSLVYKD